MHRARLEHLANVVLPRAQEAYEKALREGALIPFDMGTYADYALNSEEAKQGIPLGVVPPQCQEEQMFTCGTAGCALGAACLDAQFRQEGLELLWVSHIQCLMPHYKKDRSLEAAQSFFSIEHMDAHYLFDPSYYEGFFDNTPITPDEVRGRVLELLSGEVDR